MSQITIDDMMYMEQISAEPSRTAYIDECGSFGFDFTKSGNSKYYLICAIIVKDENVPKLHDAVKNIKQQNGFQNTELKSSSVGNSYNRRNKIFYEFLQIDFKAIVLIANKEEFVQGSPLTEYKPSFIKFLHQRLYDMLYRVYPKLKIVEDEVGSTEFQESFKKYVHEHRPEYNMFNQYDFDYTDSKNESLVQLADFMGGSIYKSLSDAASPDYLEMLKGKVMAIGEFPKKSVPFFATADQNDKVYDRDIYELAIKSAYDFIEDNKDSEIFEKKMQIALLEYLLFQVHYVNAKKYVSSAQLLNHLREQTDEKVRRDFLYRRVIAQLRDSGVLLASCAQGYKIPISVADIVTYLNQTHTVVSPMLHRIEICRNLIKQKTENNLDVLDDSAFLRYKKYFD